VQHNKNENIFKDINKPNILYILGLFAADGHFSKRRFNISLSITDRDILEKIKKIIEYTGELSIIPAKTNKQGVSSNMMCKLDICSTKMCEDIKRLGYSSRKTYEGFNLPEVSDELMWHFIRGYFDGDGSFTYRENNRDDTGYSNKCYKFSICSKTNQCLTQILSFFNKFGIKTKIWHHAKKDVFYLEVNRKNSIRLLYINLYKDAELFLQRKKEKFENAPLAIKIQGVYIHNKKYKATLAYNKKDVLLGLFSSKEEAIDFRDKTCYILYGHTAKLNNEKNRTPPSEKDTIIILDRLKKYSIEPTSNIL